MNQTFIMNAKNRPQLIAKINALDCSATLWSIEIKPRKSKRSSEQNRRMWLLYTELGKFLGLDSDEVHQLMGYKFLRYQKEVNGKTEEFIKSTTKLDTKAMGEYQDAIERFGAGMGFIFEDIS
jgi:hypothetical protein